MCPCGVLSLFALSLIPQPSFQWAFTAQLEELLATVELDARYMGDGFLH